MNANSENIVEASGDSVEQAISKGLATLGAGPHEVIVEVLQDPAPAMFGMEARQAVVRLQRIIHPKPPMVERDSPAKRANESASRRREGRSDRGGRSERSGRGENRRRGDPTASRERASEPEMPAYFDVEEDPRLPFNPQENEVPESEYDEEAAVGKVVLNEMLERMDMRVKIAVRRAQADEQGGRAPWVLDVYGGSAQRLIGRRGEVLAALQYVARLITSRELQRRSDVIIDVESYKSRRAQQLHALAVRMADEAVSTARVITLEPMPPHERRIIHLALRSRDDVETRSVGEGDARKVTIIPKQKS
jgi:spoIIIJ-associated protein